MPSESEIYQQWVLDLLAKGSLTVGELKGKMRSAGLEPDDRAVKTALQRLQAARKIVKEKQYGGKYHLP